MDPEPTIPLRDHDPAIFKSYMESVLAAKVVMPKLLIYRYVKPVQALTQVQKLAVELGDPAAARLMEDEIARISDMPEHQVQKVAVDLGDPTAAQLMENAVSDMQEYQWTHQSNPFSGHFQKPCYLPDNYQYSGQGPSESARLQYPSAYAGTPCQSQPPFMPAMSPSTPSRRTGAQQPSVEGRFPFKPPPK